MYEFDAPGTIRTHDEYLQCDLDITDVDSTQPNGIISTPLLVGQEAIAPNVRHSHQLTGKHSSVSAEQEAPVARPESSPAKLRRRVATPTSSARGGEDLPPAIESETQREGVTPRTTCSAPETEADKPSEQPTRVRRPRWPPTLAESGRPETGAEFAACMKDKFVLKGPRERTEGGMGTMTQPPPVPASITSETRRIAPITYPHDEHLLQEAKGRYKEDSFFEKILATPKVFKNFTLTEDGFIHLKLHDRIVICIPDIRIGERTLKEMIIYQAHSLLAHLGSKKTVSYLREYIWWESMVHNVAAFCASCTTCQRSKPPNQKLYGLLNLLSVPSTPWDAIGVDFVGLLPESKDRDGLYDSITVIIDLLTTMIHLVPSRTTYTAKDIAELMFAEVYKLHGLPRTIVSDRDVLFTSQFWMHLNKLMGVKQRMSSAYHPETDGSTE